jgi:hypothetical protein
VTRQGHVFVSDGAEDEALLRLLERAAEAGGLGQMHEPEAGAPPAAAAATAASTPEQEGSTGTHASRRQQGWHHGRSHKRAHKRAVRSRGGGGGRLLRGVFGSDDRVDCPRVPTFPFTAVGQVRWGATQGCGKCCWGQTQECPRIYLGAQRLLHACTHARSCMCTHTCTSRARRCWCATLGATRTCAPEPWSGRTSCSPRRTACTTAPPRCACVHACGQCMHLCAMHAMHSCMVPMHGWCTGWCRRGGRAGPTPMRGLPPSPVPA